MSILNELMGIVTGGRWESDQRPDKFKPNDPLRVPAFGARYDVTFARYSKSVSQKPEKGKAMSNPPIDSVRVGAVNANIFKNERKDGGEPFYSTSLSRAYKDNKSGEWKHSQSFGKRDLDALSQVITVARERIDQHEGQDRGKGQGRPDAGADGGLNKGGDSPDKGSKRPRKGR